MNRLYLLMILLLLVVVAQGATRLRSAQPNDQTRTEQKLRQLERDWDAAIVRKDMSTLDRILSADFLYVDSVGAVNPRAAVLDGIKNSEAVIEPFETEDVSVRVYGNTAILTGRFAQRATYKGQTFSGQFRYTDVYVKRGSNWQAVSAHTSRIPDKKD
jgi:ketosteroid isomerase-like protein